MDSKDFIKLNPAHQTIPEYLNCKLFCHEGYIENSLIFICRSEGKSLHIDKSCINNSLSKQDKQFVENIMANIIKTNSSVLEDAYNISLTSSFFLDKEIMDALIIGTKEG